MRKRNLTLLILSSLAVLTGISLVVTFIFLVKFVYVPVGSMANTVLRGDGLVIKKSFGDLTRGQVVIFKYPGDQQFYIARIVGLPGETIQLNKRSVLINDQVLEEECVLIKPEELRSESLEELTTERKGPYRVFYTFLEGEADGPIEEMDESTFGLLRPYKMPDSCYFMLGDNRDNSQDSRYRGCVRRELIWGSAETIYWSQLPGGEPRWDRILMKIK